MLRIHSVAKSCCAGKMLAVLFILAGLVSMGLAVLPVPAAAGAQRTNETKPSTAGTLEVVASLSPDSAPPGGQGSIVVIGQNFKDGMTLQFHCKGAQFSASSVKVESPTRLVAQISVPLSAQEGPCGAGQGSVAGKEPFRISNSAPMAVAVPIQLMGEGDMQYGDLMMSMSKVAMAASQNGGNSAPSQLEIDGGTIRYVSGGTSTFTQSTSDVKKVEQIQVYGQNLPYFRIIFNDGKVYNFGPAFGAASGADPNSAFNFLKSRLGK